MTPDEAHDYTMELVKELQASGIETTVKVYTSTEGRQENWSKLVAETVAKYGGQPGRASPEKWCNVDFKPATPEHKAAISEAAKKLTWVGIAFDLGGGMGVVDWELDWSFRLSEKPDAKHEEALNVLEELEEHLEAGGEGPAAGDQGKGPLGDL